MKDLTHKIPVSETFLRIQGLLSDITGNDPEDIFPDSFLQEDLNMTPMELAQFLASIEGTFGIKLRREDMADFDTIQDLVDEIDERVS